MDDRDGAVLRISNVLIENFRGISSASIDLTGTTILLGDNNTGKSTVFEALELALGPDRLYRRPVIDEHDFYGGRYLTVDDDPIEIRIEVTLVELGDELESVFRNHLEFLDADGEVVTGAEDAEDLDGDDADSCLRVQFIGKYSAEDDDFVGETIFMSPVAEVGTPPQRCTAVDKRHFGFLYLRALRTGSRAMSMEKGSLLDVILRTFEVEVQMWEDLLILLRGVSVAGGSDSEFGKVLGSIDGAMKDLVTTEWAESPHLRVSELTREDLRHVLKSFMATGVGDHAAPFNHQGSGTVNSLVIAMLSLIAQKRNGSVVFAMEEPEISLPPTTQKRVVDKIMSIAGQALFTSHSPFVVEEFEPEQMLIMNRHHQTGVLSATPVSLSKALKPKVFKEGLRTRFCEALLARRVIVTEGKAEATAYPFVSKLAARQEPSSFTRLDTGGWAIFDAQGETNVANFAIFFRGLGKTVVTIFDKQEPAEKEAIEAASDLAIEQDHKGFEDLLLKEVHPSARARFVDGLIATGAWPVNVNKPSAGDGYDAALKSALVKSKGESMAIDLLSECTIDELPATMKNALLAIQAMPQRLTVNDPVSEEPAPSGSVEANV